MPSTLSLKNKNTILKETDEYLNAILEHKLPLDFIFKERKYAREFHCIGFPNRSFPVTTSSRLQEHALPFVGQTGRGFDRGE